MKTLDLNDVPWKNHVDDNVYYYVFLDGFPVSEGHLLFVPKKDDQMYIARCLKDAWKEGARLVRIGKIDSYNIGMNCGEEAGQSVGWPHVHMIPRFKGDMENPRGGVRGVIPSKQNYK